MGLHDYLFILTETLSNKLKTTTCWSLILTLSLSDQLVAISSQNEEK